MPTCIAPPVIDSTLGACGAPSVVDATCEEGAWSCPPGSRAYARAPEVASCHPFDGAGGVWGLGGFSRVPTGDGRCLWIADSGSLPDGTMTRNVAFLADPTAPFGACPTESMMTPAPIVTMEGGDDPDILVQIDGGYRLGGATRVLYRLFAVDPSSPVGVREVSGGIGQWDPGTQRIVVPPPGAPPPWGLDLDLGDAIVPDPDGLHAFVFGCAQPGGFLVQGCELARLDAAGDVELWSKSGAWVAGTNSALGATLFSSGNWTSSVLANAGSFLHVYIPDFGTTFETDAASTITGPWSPGARLGACALPAEDLKAFCAGATVHQELSDPTRPGELPVSYGIGTTGPMVGNPSAYAATLVWLQ